jgi:hypothetical protein
MPWVIQQCYVSHADGSAAGTAVSGKKRQSLADNKIHFMRQVFSDMK